MGRLKLQETQEESEDDDSSHISGEIISNENHRPSCMNNSSKFTQTSNENCVQTFSSNRVFSYYKIDDLLSFKGLVVGIIICIFACLMYIVLANDQIPCSSASFEDINDQLELLRKKFPSQNLSLWAGIISGLMNLEKKPVEPAVYLLTFDEHSIKSSTCIVEVITTLATRLLQPCQPRETRKWLLLNGTTLSKSSSKDPGDLIEAIAKENEYSQIVLVPDVQKIPAKLAQGFHSLVDTYGMMAKRQGAVYIFTLMIPRLDDSSAITRVVEQILLENWKDLDKDELQSLVTRISHFILPVTEEVGVPFCPLKIDSTVDVQIP